MGWKAMSKNKIYDILIIILLDIGLSCLPFGLIPISLSWIYIFQIIAQFLTFFLIKLVLKKSQLICEKKECNSKLIPLFIPIFLVCFSNFFCLFDSANSLCLDINFESILRIVLSICVAFNEEVIFRTLLLNNMNKESPSLFRIVLSSAIFAACHLTHFFSSFNPGDLIVVAYTFGIGIILGMIYLYTGSFIWAFIFHALYNVANSVLTSEWIAGRSSFYLVNIIVTVVAAVYLTLIYFFKLKSEKEA